MEKYKIDECTGWEYELKGDYYYPTGRIMKDGVLTPKTVDNESKEEAYVGIWGRGSPVETSAAGRSADRGGSRDQRHLRFILEHKKALYLDLLLSGRLNAYLVDVNAQAEDMFFRVVKELSAQEDVTETLKAENQLLWV